MKLYSIFGPDIYFEMASTGATCTKCDLCGYRIPDYMDASGPVSIRKNFSVIVSSDGQWICSDKFKSIITGNATGKSIDNDNFRELKGTSSCFWQIRPEKIVTCDPERGKMKFKNRCPSCKKWESVTGAIPTYLMPNQDFGRIYLARTDLTFGSGDEKSPLLVVGEGIKDDLEKEISDIEYFECL